jgi:hypothetical protein
VDGGADDWAREVVLSARRDAPSESFRRRLRRDIQVLCGAAGLAGMTTTTSAKALVVIFAKWTALGALGGAVTLGAASEVERLRTESAERGRAQRNPTRAVPRQGARNAPVPVTTASRTRAADVHSPSAASSDAQRLVSEGDRGATHPAESARPVAAADAEADGISGKLPTRSRKAAAIIIPPAALMAKSAPQAPSAGAPTPLAEEISAINAVRAALAESDPQRAMLRLDAYERRYPTGRFALEAKVLRIDAFAAGGDPASARRLAEHFLALHPSSPYAERLRRMTRAATP